MGKYQNLDVWKLSCSFSDRVDAMLAQLPVRVSARYADQLSRAADSIHENIAEGCGLNSDRQLAKYLRLALGSANECEDELLTLSRRRHLPDSAADLLPIARQLCAMLASFIIRVEGGHRRGPPLAEPAADSRANSRPPSN